MPDGVFRLASLTLKRLAWMLTFMMKNDFEMSAEAF